MAPAINPAFRLRPLDLGDVLDEAFRIYRARFGLMFGTALIASLPGLLMGIGGGLGALTFLALQSSTGPVTPLRPEGFDTSLAWVVVAGLVAAVLFFPVSAAAPNFAACAAALGLPGTPWSVTVQALRNYLKLWVLTVVLLVLKVFLALSFLLLPLLLLYPYVNWSFTYQAIYLEHASLGGSFSRSAQLVRGSWWRIFGIRLLAYLITAVVSFVVSSTVGILALTLPNGLVRQGLTGVAGALASCVLLPYAALVVTLLYLDQRVRLESLDLQLMASHAGQPETEQLPSMGVTPVWSDLPPPPAG